MVREDNRDKIPKWLRDLPQTEEVWTSLIQTLTGHSGSVQCIAFSPDGKQIASGSYDRTIKLWDAATGDLQKTLEGHLDLVRCIVFSPDGKQIASGSSNKTIKLWDTATGDLQKTLEGHLGWVWCIVFSPDGKQIASGSSDETIKLWDATTGDLRSQKTLEGHSGSVQCIAFSPDGKQIASGSDDETIKLWDAGVRSVVFPNNRKQILSGSADKTTVSKNTAKSSRFSRLVRGIFSTGPKQPTTQEEIKIDEFDKLLQTFEKFEVGGLVDSLRFSADGQQLITNLGQIKIKSSVVKEGRVKSDLLESLRADNGWIYYGLVPVIRLSAESELLCYDMRGDQLAIGLRNGRVLRLDINRKNLQSMLNTST